MQYDCHIQKLPSRSHSVPIIFINDSNLDIGVDDVEEVVDNGGEMGEVMPGTLFGPAEAGVVVTGKTGTGNVAAAAAAAKAATKEL